MGTLENTFSWSNSRAGTFRRCLRAYWWQYYGSWGGWERGCDPTTRKAYVLKNLSTRWAWVGTAVHEWIERVLKRQRDRARKGQLQFETSRLDVDAEVEALTDAMRRQWAQSRKGLYRDNPKRNFGLMEHEYDDPVSRDEWQRTSDKARVALRGFLESELYARIEASDPATWLTIESLDQFELDGVGVWASPDFVRRVDDGAVELYDWKTGAVTPEKSRLQLACYTLFMRSKHGVDPSSLACHLVYLGDALEIHPFTFSEEDLEQATDEIRASMDAMRARLADPAANRAERESFPLTEDRSRCAHCVYRQLCGR